jgi:transcriptional regulator with XRE-family HTH domain
VTTPTELGALVRWLRGVRQLPLENVAAGTGVSQDLLRGLEKADRNVRLSSALDVLAALGLDVVLVPRDPTLNLRDPAQGQDADSGPSGTS